MGDAPIPSAARALIVGGNGKTARRLTVLLTDARIEVHSIIRNEAQIPDLEAIGAHPIVQDLVSGTVDDLRRIIERVRPTTVFWAASNPRAPFDVDRDGAIKVIDALAAADVPSRRYVAISAADLRDRDVYPMPYWYSEADARLSDRMWGAIGPALRAKFEADRDLVTRNGTRGLRYTIVRPGGLVESEPAGRARAGKVGLVGTISREDLAAALIAAAENGETVGLVFDLLGPGERDLPLRDAIAGVAERREDTFEGFY